MNCPTCGASEMHPTENKLLIRAYKVSLNGGKTWDSQCLVCAGYYNPDLTERDSTDPRINRKAGWF